MNARPLAAILIFIAAAIAPLIARQTANTTVEFKVIDIQGAAIYGATIRITPNPDSTRLSFETDRKGTVVVTAGPGDYNFRVTRSGFAVYSSAFKLTEDAPPRSIQVTMKVGSTGSPENIIPPPPANELRVESVYFPGESAVLTPDDLKGLRHISATVRNPDTNQDEKYAGVPLLDVLIRAGALSSLDIGLMSRFGYLVVTGNSGAGCVIALSELDPLTSNTAIIVADSLNGRLLSDKLGPLRLILANEKTLARSVDILNSIRLDYAR
jgi:hypothetical protein